MSTYSTCIYRKLTYIHVRTRDSEPDGKKTEHRFEMINVASAMSSSVRVKTQACPVTSQMAEFSFTLQLDNLCWQIKVQVEHISFLNLTNHPFFEFNTDVQLMINIQNYISSCIQMRA